MHMHDQVDESDVAAQLLTFAPEHFKQSALDHALVDDPEARKFRSLSAHGHTQDLATRYFRGDETRHALMRTTSRALQPWS